MPSASPALSVSPALSAFSGCLCFRAAGALCRSALPGPLGFRILRGAHAALAAFRAAGWLSSGFLSRTRDRGTAPGSLGAVTTATLDQALERFVRQVGHWEAPRWATPLDGTPGTRADALHALITWVADSAADAEGEPRRPIPRLPHDPALVDQLRVVVADLQAATPPPLVLTEAATRLTAFRHLL